jgi:S-DNA-T family DNA segregation ATPase FtsK/SpoIIIE
VATKQNDYKKTSPKGNTRQNQTTKKSTSRKRTSQKSNSSKRKYTKEESERIKLYHDEITLTVTLVISLLLILSNFDLSGEVGKFINQITFGIIGFLAYVLPFILFFGVAFYIANRGNRVARVKINSSIGLFIVLSALIQLSTTKYSNSTKILEYYTGSSTSKNGGGILGGIICKLFNPLFGKFGTYIVLIAIMLILVMFITGKALISILSQKGESYLSDRKERRLIEEEEYEANLENGMVEKRKARTVLLKKDNGKNIEGVTKTEGIFSGKNKKKNKSVSNEDGSVTGANMTEIKNEKPDPKDANGDFNSYEEILKEKFGNKKVEESNPNTLITPNTVPIRPNIDEDISRLLRAANADMEQEMDENNYFDDDFRVDLGQLEDVIIPSNEEVLLEDEKDTLSDDVSSASSIMEENHLEPIIDATESQSNAKSSLEEGKPSVEGKSPSENLHIDPTSVLKKEYRFPPIDLLSKPKANTKGMSDRDLKETANKLQKTLESFGVRVTITNVSCGPSVTRYELQPEQGVKVSRITGLADDIKLNLAAADVRIEAPIPGKAAVGIEVPNKENTAVMFRELLDSQDFKKHPSNIAFAVGKDIGGQTIVTDIGKMPHLLIAGATGSGKSVCINTLIMSILYKANPDDVRMIMVDPKVVELSVYNGIPHLLTPVVTDPKKASAALNWAVMEMTERYNKFAELGVRDIKGYNEKIATVEEFNDERFQKLPQIVIIVDELADLMMVAPGEVEDAICRLAQMARAAGLHLIIATQRPSVNVITGLIKANIPSRIAFSVSSAIDSRTIIDGSGAEKLLGKGDMLFFPSGYPKPIRVQGAFVSDKEVSSVVEFLKTQNEQPQYSEEVTSKITSTSAVDSSVAASGNDRDDYFIEAGKFIIEKDKASIGMLQRVYKIGFNRAARIMDQLSEAGVVGPEEGTKPRKIIMSLEEFENYVDEYV